VRLFTRGLPYVPSTKNHPTCKNYIASYKAFQEHQLNSRRFPVFPGAISNSRRFPGVVDTLSEPKTKNPVKVNWVKFKFFPRWEQHTSLPGLTSRNAASAAWCAARMTSALRPVTLLSYKQQQNSCYTYSRRVHLQLQIYSNPSNSSMHCYECTAPCKRHKSPLKPILCQISSHIYPKIQRTQVIMNVLHPSCARPPRWSPPVLWRRFDNGLASICILIHSCKMPKESGPTGLNDGWKRWLVGNAKDIKFIDK